MYQEQVKCTAGMQNLLLASLEPEEVLALP
jgi:hypothetical protein